MVRFGDIVSLGETRAFKEQDVRRISDVKPLRSTEKCRAVASLTRVLKLRYTLKERIEQWAHWGENALNDFERNSRMAATFYIRTLGYEAASENAAPDSGGCIPWDGGPEIKAGIVAELIPDVVTESWLLEGDPKSNSEMVLAECLHLVFADVYAKVEEMRDARLLELTEAGGNLAALYDLTDAVDSMCFAQIPSPTELSRDLFLGFAKARGMHIRGSRASFAQDGRFYTSLEICPSDGVTAQQICEVLNGLINIEDPTKCRELLREVEVNRP